MGYSLHARKIKHDFVCVFFPYRAASCRQSIRVTFYSRVLPWCGFESVPVLLPLVFQIFGRLDLRLGPPGLGQDVLGVGLQRFRVSGVLLLQLGDLNVVLVP